MSPLQSEGELPLVALIGGPTASGKTRLAVELALAVGGEVVSADSMQIYRRMDIGTAKPTLEERRGVPHHMLDVAEPGENFSVARYVELAWACVEDILRRGRLPILAGGTGLYLDSLVSGRSFAPYQPERPLRQALQKRAREEGSQALWEELRRVDPESALRLHPNDEKRIIRALEVWQESGESITLQNRRTQALPPRCRCVRLLLSFQDRQQLYARIDERVEEMLSQGLVEEVRSLLAEGVEEGCTAMQAIGYKEIARALRSGGDLRAAAEEVKLRSRQYAKRQLSWFRRMPEAHWFLWGEDMDFPRALRDSTQILRDAGLQ